MKQIRINSKFKPLYDENTRYYIITGERGSAKSFSVADYLTKKTFEKNQVIYFTRYTMDSTKDSIIPEFNEKIDLLNANDFFYINIKDIQNKLTGSQIKFRGVKASQGSQTAKLKGLTNATVWVIDEAEEFTDEKLFDNLNKSLRGKNKDGTDKKFIIIFILNPTYRRHFIFEKWFKGAGVPENSNIIKNNVTYIHMLWKDNKENLDSDFIAEAEWLEKNDPEKYKKIYATGWLDPDAGLVFKYKTNWDYYKEEPENYDAIYYGGDFGFSNDPTTAVQVKVDKKNKTVYIKELLYQTGLLNSQIADILRPIVKENYIIFDSAEPKSIVSLRNEHKLNALSAVKGADSIRAGIERMKEWNMLVYENSSNLINELFNYAYVDKEGLTNQPIDKHNDIIDAARYVFLKYRL